MSDAPELFGAGHQANRLISYAASFGNTTLESLKKYQVADQVAQWLRAFDALSVRDRTGTDRKRSGLSFRSCAGL